MRKTAVIVVFFAVFATGVILPPRPAAAQSYPVYWDVRRDSYRWAANLVDFATQTWVLLQGYQNAAQVTNIAESVSASVTTYSWDAAYGIADGLTPARVVTWAEDGGLRYPEFSLIEDAWHTVDGDMLVARETYP